MDLNSLIDKETLKSALLEQLVAGNGNNTPSPNVTPQTAMASGRSGNISLETLESTVNIRCESLERRVTFLENMIVAMSGD